MWAPADLFTPPLNAVTSALKGIVSYFYEHLLVFALVVIVVAAVIGLLGMRRT